MDDTKEKGQKEISAYLDRIEELEDGAAEAVFLFEDEEGDFIEFTLPTDYLPEDVDEGEYLTIKIFREAETSDAAEEVFTFTEEESPLPTELLPEGDGEYFAIEISRDKDKTAEALNEAQELLKGNDELGIRNEE